MLHFCTVQWLRSIKTDVRHPVCAQQKSLHFNMLHTENSPSSSVLFWENWFSIEFQISLKQLWLHMYIFSLLLHLIQLASNGCSRGNSVLNGLFVNDQIKVLVYCYMKRNYKKKLVHMLHVIVQWIERAIPITSYMLKSGFKGAGCAIVTNAPCCAWALFLIYYNFDVVRATITFLHWNIATCWCTRCKPSFINNTCKWQALKVLHPTKDIHRTPGICHQNTECNIWILWILHNNNSNHRQHQMKIKGSLYTLHTYIYFRCFRCCFCRQSNTFRVQKGTNTCEHWIPRRKMFQMFSCMLINIATKPHTHIY